MTKGSLLRDIGLATGLLLAFAGSAHAAKSGDEASARQPYPLADSTKFVVQGSKNGVGASSGANCRIPQPSLSLAPRERAIEVRQLSLNPRTCRATFERGVPPKSEQASSAAKARGAGMGAQEAGGVSALANGYRYSGYGRAWYRDARTGKAVTEVFAGADWNSNGRCVGRSNVFFSNFANTRTGWDEVSHRWRYLDDSCDRVVSKVDAHFRDRNFSGCSGGPRVDSYYRAVRFAGYPDGRISGSRTSRNEPSCKNTLIAFFALYRR